MSDDDIDDLPEIFMNSSSHGSDFNMPTVDEIVRTREREAEVDRRLAEIRARHSAELAKESEERLAAAVDEMNVDSEPEPEPELPRFELSTADMLSAFADLLTGRARETLLDPGVAQHLPEVVVRASQLICAQDVPWTDEEVMATGVLLATASIAHDAIPRAGALRAFHTLLEHCTTGTQATNLGRMLMRGLPEPRARLELADALRAGGPPTCGALARAVLEDTLVAMMEPDAPGRGMARVEHALRAGFMLLDSEDSYVAVQLLGRRLAELPQSQEECDVRKRLLAPLIKKGRQRFDPNDCQQIMVVVAMSKLQLLFE